ncbi:hypothetical protein IT570_09880 [Candidatus Sumerlaeota bacterium]|nr:hypothetical protein [Candidatus Sumerlaeota bacterium]
MIHDELLVLPAHFPVKDFFMVGPHLRRAIAALAMFSLAVLSLASCSSVSRADLFKNKEAKAPINGRALEPDAWEKFATVDQKRNLRSSKTGFWLLPFTLSVHDFAVSPNRDAAVNRNVMWNDLLTPLLLTTLPLHFSYSEYQYEKGIAEPVSKTGFRWTLLWAQTESRGKETDFKFRAKGIPLFYAFVSARNPGKKVNLSFNHSLWTLGPALLRMDVDEKLQKQKGYFFAPLLLGGALGGVVWTDYYVVARDEKTAMGHGPLFGALGFWKQRSQWVSYTEAAKKDEPPIAEVKGTQSVSGVLLGILWSQYERRDMEGRIDKSRYGPLWTMFGWSHRDGKFAVKFLWLPIRF